MTALNSNELETDRTASEPSHHTEPETFTLEAVRNIVSTKSIAGHTDAIRALLKKHGSNKLSELDPIEYPALIAEVRALGNG